MVIERRNIDAVGTDFLVKPIREDRLSNSCEYNVQPGDFEIPNETAEYFLGLHDYLLILDSGTGPSPPRIHHLGYRKTTQSLSGVIFRTDHISSRSTAVLGLISAY